MTDAQRGARAMITAEWLAEHDACEYCIAWWHEHGEIADVDACIQALADGGHEDWVMWLAAEARWTGHAATTYTDGSRWEECYRDGKLHREDGPACVTTHPDGTRSESWYRDGKLHREDGPAIVTTRHDGYRWESWYCNGRRCAK